MLPTRVSPLLLQIVWVLCCADACVRASTNAPATNTYACTPIHMHACKSRGNTMLRQHHVKLTPSCVVSYCMALRICMPASCQVRMHMQPTVDRQLLRPPVLRVRLLTARIFFSVRGGGGRAGGGAARWLLMDAGALTTPNPTPYIIHPTPYTLHPTP